MEKDDVVDTLNNLIETCKDGEYGFTASAEHVRSASVRQIFAARAMECREAALELQQLVRHYGGKAEDDGSVSAAMHRGWVSVKGTLAGYSDVSMLEECERGEDAAVARYRKALQQDLPADVLLVVQRQMSGVQRNHDQIRRLRDEARASEHKA